MVSKPENQPVYCGYSWVLGEYPVILQGVVALHYRTIGLSYAGFREKRLRSAKFL